MISALISHKAKVFDLHTTDKLLLKCNIVNLIKTNVILKMECFIAKTQEITIRQNDTDMVTWLKLRE